MNKRSFLKQMAAFGFASPFLFQDLDHWVGQVAHQNPEETAHDEEFWARVRSGYRLKPDYINLESGYYCIQPQETLENFIHHVREVNYQGSYYMRTVQWDNKRYIHEQLADIAGCTADELVVTRNTTESLDLIIGGFPWQEGDEAVMAEQDYGAMLDMFDLQALRHGIVCKRVSIPNHPASDEEIVELYANAITPRTRLLMVCHMVNITGHVLPIRKICDMAHERGVEVMVDGAHAFGHLVYNIPDLGCDYYGSSLHKWLSVPLGAGLLYVRRDKIPHIWPLYAEREVNLEEDDIRRLNHIGTHPVHTDLAIGNAIEYYRVLGPERKEARLRYLQRYWTSQLRDTPGIVINTPADEQRSCAIANVGIEGMRPGQLSSRLLKEYRIWTVAIDRVGVQGCRITPNVFTTTRELDVFVEALTEMAKDG